MANIVFVLAPVTGSLNSSLKLAKTLRDSGHGVSYIGLADSEEHVLRNGLEFNRLYETWFPKGLAAEITMNALINGSASAKAFRTDTLRRQAFLEAIVAEKDTEFQETMAAIKPDLIVHIHSDPLMVVLALLTCSFGTSVVYLRDMLGRSEYSAIPPMGTDIIPSGAISQLRTYLAWRKSAVLRRYRKAYYRLAYGADFDGMIRKVASKCGYPWSLVDRSGIPAYTLRLPEIVLCPKEFDFPQAEKPGRYYAEASIDVDRDQPPFPWESLDGMSPLVYCALGTLTWFPQSRYRAFYQAVIDASRSRPNWQWVVALGDILPVQDFRDVPDNVILVNQAPQLQLLKRASMMITHGGTNTIKECIYYGVPMVVYPLGYDHPGNAARVVYHGLGVKGTFLKVTAEQVRDLVNSVNSDPYYRMQVRLMQAKFREVEDAQLGVRLINAIVQEQAVSQNRGQIGRNALLDAEKRRGPTC
ncbi:MAG: nucleotide disphospho-sugar-binding domain-containing protein [Gammaproteobacteria bacterium]